METKDPYGELKKENERLKKALWTFAQHGTGCIAAKICVGSPCTCGLDAVLYSKAGDANETTGEYEQIHPKAGFPRKLSGGEQA